MTAKRAKNSSNRTRKASSHSQPAATAARTAPARPAKRATRAAAAPDHKTPAAGTPATSRARPARTLREVVLDALDELKAFDVKALDVRGLTDITDTMVVASGTSDRHVRSIADRVVQRCKEAGFRPFGIEGERDGEWVLLDLNDLVLHVMLPRVREFYALEKLWAANEAAA
jgi:ribosome-associated protein